MKFVFIFLVVCVAAASCGVYDAKSIDRPTSKEFLIRQKNLFRLLNNVHMPNANKDQVYIGKNYNIIANLDKYTNAKAVKEFLEFYRIGMLEKYKIFSVSYRKMRLEAIALFDILYFAKDWNTFYETACWAREFMNEGMFVYAISVAVLHRKDCIGIELPAPYELYPFYFVNNEVIDKAKMLKMQEKIFDTNEAHQNGIYQDGKTFYIYSNYSGWYTSLNDETALTYFTEDIGLNSFYFYFHLDYPFWMYGDIFGLNKDRRGELFYYVHQQLLARYYMERLSNGLGEIPNFFWNRPIRTGFLSNIRFSNGMKFPSRPNFFDMNTESNIVFHDYNDEFETNIRDAVQSGFVFGKDGGMVDLMKDNGIDLLGNIIQGNEDSPNPRFYRYRMFVAQYLLGNSYPRMNNRHDVTPSVLQQYETALRDPMFYQLFKRYMHYFFRHKESLKPYTRMELELPGVKIDNIYVDKLITFFDYFNIDISSAVCRKEYEMATNKDDFLFIARQPRLNHKRFDIRIDVDSDKKTDVIIRMFLGPKYDGKGNKININDNKYNFFEIDSFLYTLESGKNAIIRNSNDFSGTNNDRTSVRDLLRQINDDLDGGKSYTLDMREGHNLFPDRLVLPKGNEGGMAFQLFVIISSHQAPKTAYGTGFDFGISAGVGTGARYIDNRAFGYPLDRFIDEYEFYTPNMFMKDVIIFHDPKIYDGKKIANEEMTIIDSHEELNSHPLDNQKD